MGLIIAIIEFDVIIIGLHSKFVWFSKGDRSPKMRSSVLGIILRWVILANSGHVNYKCLLCTVVSCSCGNWVFQLSHPLFPSCDLVSGIWFSSPQPISGSSCSLFLLYGYNDLLLSFENLS